MTWLTLDDAVKQVMAKKSSGAHIFYYPDKDAFMVLRDSRRGQYAEARIFKDKEFYQGYIRDIRGSRRKGVEPVTWTAANVIHELVTILEHNAHNFSSSSASIICQDEARSPIFADEDKERIHDGETV